MLGLLAGGVIFGLTYQQVMPEILKVSNLGNVVMPDLWNLNPFLLVGVFAAVVLLLFYFLENGLQRSDPN